MHRELHQFCLKLTANDENAASLHRREVPREQLLLIIRSFGGIVAWEGEGSPHAEADEAITHQVNCNASNSTRSMPLVDPLTPVAQQHQKWMCVRI